MDRQPTLYKRTSTGAVERWSIWTEGATIVTEYGHVGGAQQRAQETAKGKNIGRANETTPEEQAALQAKSEWEAKRSRKGYVEDLKRAEAGENDGVGGIRPMLAQKFDESGHKIKYPCYAQPKLDGIRCIAVVGASGTVTLWSREQKPIVAVPSIAEAVARLNLPEGTVLDGELYNHELKDDFEKISSCVRKQYAASLEEQALIEYHVYDMPRHPKMVSATFGKRSSALYAHLLGKGSTLPTASAALSFCFVETVIARSEVDLLAYRKKCQLEGFEGCMARNDAPYEEGKRSYGLQKLKTFLEDDFKILAVKEGVGKMAGLAIFRCEAQNGNPFDVKMEGELEGLRKYLHDEKLWRGKTLTVKYFALTNKNRVPRFPVGKAVRDYE